MSSSYWKTLVYIYLFACKRKELERHFFNTTKELLQIVQENKLCHPKQQWIGYLIIWCHLFIACCDFKTGVFQQTVVRVYYILNFGLPQSLSYGQYCSVLPNFAVQH